MGTIQTGVSPNADVTMAPIASDIELKTILPVHRYVDIARANRTPTDIRIQNIEELIPKVLDIGCSIDSVISLVPQIYLFLPCPRT